MSAVCDIIKYIHENIDNDYSDILKHDGRWEVFYHLSPMRCSILNWYDFKPTGTLLEIGGEFGALTGLFCERCAYVKTIVRTEEEKEAIEKRHCSHENLEVVIGDYTELHLEQQYDYIVMVGSFEKIFQGSAEQKKYADYLVYLKQFLKSDGVLLLTLSNRYGLKYFCGARDEFFNEPFAGINRYPNGSSGYAFAKNEAEALVKKSGFAKYKFHYPMPDYILTQAVYSQDYLPTGNICDRVMPYYPDKMGLVAAEADLYDAVIANGAFEFLANSFLLECTNGENISDIVYTALSTDRGCKHGFATSIHDNGTVSKRALFREGVENLYLAYENIMDLENHGINVIGHTWKENQIQMPCIEQPNFMEYLHKIVKEDLNEFLNLMDKIYQCILQSAEYAEKEENVFYSINGSELDYGVILKKAYIDMVPMNCFWMNGDFYFFDQEFVKENYPAKYVMFRNILYFYNYNPRVEEFISQSELKERYGLTDLWNIFMEEERKFVADNRNWELYGHFYGWTMLDKEEIYHKNLSVVGKYLDRDNESGTAVTADMENRKEEVPKNDIMPEYEQSIQMIQIQKIEKKILARFHEVCEQYGLTYFAVYGTLLGAVRHQDMIPWDDDVDVAMPREDYEKLILIAEEVFEEPYFLQTPENDENCFYGGYMKLRYNLSTAMEIRNWGRECNHGMWIDIFPLDNFICDNKKRKSVIREIKRCQEWLFVKSYGKNMPSSGVGEMSKKEWKRKYRQTVGMSRKWLCRRLKRYITDSNQIPSQYLTIMARYLPRENFCFFSKEAFARAIEVPFGESSIMIPQGYQECLNVMEGIDYMKNPPPEQRKPHHTAFYATDVSYRVYLNRFRNIFSNVKNKQIVVWGAGHMAEQYMKKYGRRYNPEFLVDDDMGKWGLVRYNHMIKSPSALQNIRKEQLHLIICSKYYQIIEEELADLGINEYYIHVVPEKNMLEKL